MIHIEAMTTWLTADVGGRANPISLAGGGYAPHVVVIGELELLGVVVEDGPEVIHPGQTVVVQIRGLYHPLVDYGKLQQHAQFLIREGPRVVAVGKVIRRWGDYT